MEKVSLSQYSTHHFSEFLPFMCLAWCVLQIFILLHRLSLLFLKTYPCRAILAPVEKITFPFTFLHPTKHTIVLRKQMTSARITLNQDCEENVVIVLLAALDARIHFSVLAENATALNLYFECFNIDPSHCPNAAIFLHWRHTIHKLGTNDFSMQNVWIGQRQRRWESLVNLD